MDRIAHHTRSAGSSASCSWPRRSADNLVVKHEENMNIEKQENRFAMLYILPPSVRDRIPSRSSIMSMSFASGVSPPLSEADTEVVEVEGPDDVTLAESVDYPMSRKFSSTLSSRSASPKILPSGVSWRHARQGTARTAETVALVMIAQPNVPFYTRSRSHRELRPGV